MKTDIKIMFVHSKISEFARKLWSVKFMASFQFGCIIFPKVAEKHPSPLGRNHLLQNAFLFSRHEKRQWRYCRMNPHPHGCESFRKFSSFFLFSFQLNFAARSNLPSIDNRCKAPYPKMQYRNQKPANKSNTGLAMWGAITFYRLLDANGVVNCNDCTVLGTILTALHLHLSAVLRK